MNLIHAIVLGIVQGITEFLPISSTAHLTLYGRLFHLIDPANPEDWTEFIAVMQLGTVAAVVVYFIKDVWRMAAALPKDILTQGVNFKQYSPEGWQGLLIILGTMPVAISGILFSEAIHSMLTKDLRVIACSMIGLAILLWVAEKVATHKRTIGQVGVVDSLLIGSAQALALIPGSSRSGTTMTMALFLNFTREAAARFSFLLSIPAVLASGLFEMKGVKGHAFELGIEYLVVSTIVSGVVGYAAIAWLLKFLYAHTNIAFVVYRLGLGLLLAVLLLGGWLPA